MTTLLDQAITQVMKLSPQQQEDFARWMLAELANMQEWERLAIAKADAMEWFGEDSIEDKNA